MTSDFELVVNGQVRMVAVDEPATLASVLAALELKADRIAVEHNGRIAPRTAWGTTAVAAKDKLEIVHFVGGGTSEDAGFVPHLPPQASLSNLQNMCYRT